MGVAGYAAWWWLKSSSAPSLYLLLYVVSPSLSLSPRPLASFLLLSAEETEAETTKANTRLQ